MSECLYDNNPIQRIHRHLRIVGETMYLFVIWYHIDCEIVIVDSVCIHPVGHDGIVSEIINIDPDDITDKIYEDAISMLSEDGVI